jgi:ABC-type enterochelin transport system substrate-binding protein
MRLHFPTAVLLACFLVSLGCSKTAPEGAGQGGKDATTKTSSEPKEPPVELQVKTAEETDQLIASHKGKVVIIDLWALT